MLETLDLVALNWVGRGDYTAAEWPDAASRRRFGKSPWLTGHAIWWSRRCSAIISKRVSRLSVILARL
jgi:hypothetical protein